MFFSVGLTDIFVTTALAQQSLLPSSEFSEIKQVTIEYTSEPISTTNIYLANSSYKRWFADGPR